MRTYRAAVIGLSGIGQGYPKPGPHESLGYAHAYSHVSAYVAEPRTELVAVCDINNDAVQRFQEAWGARCPKVRTFHNYEEMLQEVSPDIVSVATPDHLHANVFLRCVEGGVKGIYCEKPLATTMADARRMVASARDGGVKVAVNHTRRWHPMFIRARELIRSGAIGDLLYVGALHGGPRSMLFRNGTHFIDHVLYFTLDKEPLWVTARLGDRFLDYGSEYAGAGGKDPDLDPDGSVLIGFGGGLRGAYTAVRDSVVATEWDIQGTLGRIQLQNDHQGRLASAKLSTRIQGGCVVEQNLPYEYFDAGLMQSAVRDIVHAIERDSETLSPPGAALNTLSVLLGAVQSNRLGGKYVEMPVTDVRDVDAPRSPGTAFA